MSKVTPTQNANTIALLTKDVTYIKETVVEIKHNLEKDYITRDQFEPVKKIVYGMVAIILTAVVGALITLVVQQ